MTFVPLRGLTREALTESANVLTATVTSNAGGGATSSWVAGGTIPCRVDMLTGDEDQRGARISDSATHVVTLPPGTSIAVTDLLRVNGRGTFEVTGVRTDTGEHARFAELMAR